MIRLLAVISSATLATGVFKDNGVGVAETLQLAVVRGGDIYALRSDGTALRNLTHSKAREYSPAWSPDGRRLLYVGYRDGNAELYVATAAAKNVRRLTRDRGEDLTPAWSPDGKRIAFASNRSGEYELYVMRADGGGVRQLTSLGRKGNGSFSPAWSPDGRTIVFASSARTPENPELYSIRAGGGGLRRLTHTAGSVERLGDDAMPEWSPDGRRIVFVSNRTGNGELWIMRPDGTGQHRLAGLPRRDDWKPRYSPDGTRIAFESRTSTSDVYVVTADGRGVRLLLRNAEEPAWRPR